MMKTTILAASAIAAALFAATPDASAGGKSFSLTLASPNGLLKVSGPGPHDHRYGGKRYGAHKGYKAPRFHNPHPGPRYGGHRPHRYNPYAFCLRPMQIRAMLRYRGWYGMKVKKMLPEFAVIHAHRHGMRYRIKIDRCTGQFIKVSPKGFF